MRHWLGFLAFGALATLPVSSGCGGDDVHPVWGAICNAICDRGDDCYDVDVGLCNSLCLSEFGNVRCKANQPALDACVEGIGELSCMAIDRGELPESCDDVCLCESVDDCDDGNQCTAGMCDVDSGACSFTSVADGVSCVGDAGTCQEGRCVMACTETAIRSAVVVGGGPYAFACDGPTTVTTAGEIVIDKDLILDGGGDLTVDADGRHRVFSVASELYFPVVELRNLAITGGGETDHGGGIYNFGALTLDNCTVSGNAARGEGGGVSSNGPLTIIDTTISGNAVPNGRGGGLSSFDELTIVNSSISENTGGGLWSGGLFATIVDSTIEKNTTTDGFDEEGGAGIVNGSNMMIIGTTVSDNVAGDFEGSAIGNVGELTMLNSTVSGNVGSGIRNGGTATIISSTIAENTGERSSAIYNRRQVTLRNSIVSGGCDEWREVEWVSKGGNLESPGDNCGLDQPTDRVGLTVGELDLGPLQDNGGPTRTHDLGSRSPAIDAVPLEDCLDADGMTLTVDQRGEKRPKGSQCDTGAVESESIPETDFPCTEEGLLEAVAIGGGPHTFDCNGPTTVTTTAEIAIDQAVTLDGQGLLTVDGDDSHRVFAVHAGGVELRSITITGGRATGNYPHNNGGGIFVEGYLLTLTNTSVSGNYAERQGGGIYQSHNATLVLVDSTVSGNAADVGGGGIGNNGTLTLRNSTVSGNTAGAYAGGISNGSEATLVNSTVSGNSAGQRGGGIQNGGGPLTLTHATVSNNTAPIGPAIANSQPLTAWNSIVEGSCSLEGGGVTSEGGNLESPGDTCGLNPSVGDNVDVSTQALNLGSLQDNGGPTLTHLPGPGSAAIGKIEPNDCPEATDQRGISRPQGPLCDAGAVEVEGGL